MIQQESQLLMNRRRVDDVIVVEDQHKRRGNVGNVIDQRGQQHFRRRGLRTLQHGLRGVTDGRIDLLQRGDEVREETRRIAVALVEREPGQRPALPGGAGAPFTQQRGLAEAGGRGDQREVAGQALVNLRQQALARNEVRRFRWSVEFGCQQLHRGTGSLNGCWSLAATIP